MSERNSPTQRIDFGRIQSQVVLHRERLRCKGFIELDPIKLIQA